MNKKGAFLLGLGTGVIAGRALGGANGRMQQVTARQPIPLPPPHATPFAECRQDARHEAPAPREPRRRRNRRRKDDRHQHRSAHREQQPPAPRYDLGQMREQLASGRMTVERIVNSGTPLAAWIPLLAQLVRGREYDADPRQPNSLPWMLSVLRAIQQHVGEGARYRCVMQSTVHKLFGGDAPDGVHVLTKNGVDTFVRLFGGLWTGRMDKLGEGVIRFRRSDHAENAVTLTQRDGKVVGRKADGSPENGFRLNPDGTFEFGIGPFTLRSNRAYDPFRSSSSR